MPVFLGEKGDTAEVFFVYIIIPSFTRTTGEK
jgi:hypothetical protein